MLTHVYDKATETWLFVSQATLIDERPQENGTTTYELDLVSEQAPEYTLFNMPLAVVDDKTGDYTYAMPDIAEVLKDGEGGTYDYHVELSTPLYDCEYHNGVLVNTTTHKEPMAVASIPKATQSKTLIEAIDKLSEVLSKAKEQE